MIEMMLLLWWGNINHVIFNLNFILELYKMVRIYRWNWQDEAKCFSQGFDPSRLWWKMVFHSWVESDWSFIDLLALKPIWSWVIDLSVVLSFLYWCRLIFRSVFLKLGIVVAYTIGFKLELTVTSRRAIAVKKS